MKLTRIAACLLASVAAAAIAQEAKPRLSFRAVRTAQAPVIDGDLSDAAWDAATEITGFEQREPEEGKPATQQTKSVSCTTTTRSTSRPSWKTTVR